MNIDFKKAYAEEEGVDEDEMIHYRVSDVNNGLDFIFVWASNPAIAAMGFFDQVFEYENLEGVVVEKQLLGNICEFVGVFCLA